MEYRTLGKTGLNVSTLGFGCGGVGGLLVDGEYQTMLRVVERAIEAGINYFDTAQEYGNGRSEANLGKVLQVLKPDVTVGTKVQLTAADMEQIEDAIIKGAEVSLRRLQMERLDLFQLHTAINLQRQPERGWVGVADLEPVIAALQKLQAQGKIRFYGINGLGDTEALHQAVAEAGADTIQTCYSLLNPSAGYPMSPDFPFQNYRQLIDHAAGRQMGVIAFRVLAGGALSGQTARHPVAARSVETIASNANFETDAAQANSFQFLITKGWADNLVEAAIRFVLNHPGISTAPIGLSSMDQLEQAITAIEKGPLPRAAIDQLFELWASLDKETALLN